MPKARILVVEDEVIVAMDIQSRLRSLGYMVADHVGTGEEAVRKAGETRPDLVLMDIRLAGEMDGIQAAEKIHAEFDIPVVYLTAYADEETIQRAKVTEPFGYILKPLQERELHAAIELALFKHQAEQELREVNRHLEEALAELKRTQQQAIQQERLRALGQMTSEIAHDFMNALMPILAFSSLPLENPETLDDKEKVRESLLQINAAAKDAAQMIRRLSGFYRSRDENETFQQLNLNEVVRRVVLLSQPRWGTQPQSSGAAIGVKEELGEVPMVEGNEAELGEVLMNLIFNSVDAMPQGGVITIRTAPQDEKVRLQVSDTGIGMTEEVRQRCFEPFFTTKGQRGTGLGLAVGYGIIRRHNGTIDIDSEPGKGTTVTIRLPVAQIAEKAENV